MSARNFRIPKIQHHKASGKAVVCLSGQDHYLGGYGTPESQENYARLIATWLARGRKPIRAATVAESKATLSINELILKFWRHVEVHYRHQDGRPTSEVGNFRSSLKMFRAMFGPSNACEFGPIALKTFRQSLIPKHCRNEINKHIGRIKRMFKWAVSEELVPPSIFHGLQAVAGLQKGRSDARESKPVQPVGSEDIDKILPYLRPQVRMMVEIQRLTGMRPGEVCNLRVKFIDRAGPVWLFSPQQHKTAWRGKRRFIPIGPKAQAILAPLLEGMNPDDCVFSALATLEAKRREMRLLRKTPVQPSQQNRRKKNPKKVLRDDFSTTTYSKAIARACVKAGVPVWAPNRLRHTYGTEVRKRFGLEAAQVSLGHSRADVTQVYAERDLTLAEKVAAEIG